ncbi:MAG: TonB-dependent receptor [Rhodothermales bacterium]|nr:TonB-dependent receptor [Rhodothermales bacterium]MBO6778899.1 TonB-dependent receptor [Rhodothermales bacterium]
MTRYLAAFVLCATLAAPVLAQNATIRGFVTSTSDGQPLPGVNVVLLDAAGGLVTGTATDADGFYALSRVTPGSYTLRATFIGFETYVEEVTLAEGIVTNNFALEEAAAELEGVVVEVERETAGAANITAGLQTVRPADIDLVPAPDISADLVNYLTALPGIVSQGDRGGQLFVRGGEPTQNLVLLDGMMVYQPFHVVGFFSAFPSEIINTADVYAGGYGGKYGGRLSSVIEVAARTGNKQRFAASFSAAPFVSTARIEGPIVPGKVSLLASVRESVIEQGASKIVDEPLPFSFGDQFAKLHANLGQSSQLSITAIHTNDTGRLGLDPLSEDAALTEEEVQWENLAVGTRFIFLPATLPIFAEVLASMSQLENDFGLPDAPVRSTMAQRYNFAANVTHYLGNTDFAWGIFLSSVTLESDLGGQFQNLDLKKEFVTEVGAYMEPEFRLAGGLRIQPGIRLQSFPSKGLTFFEPRLRAVWNLGIHRFSAAGGVYHQEIVGLNDRRDAGDVFTAWVASPDGIIPEAIHGIAGWSIRPTPWLTFSAEGFYKQLKDLIVPEWTAFPRFTTRIQGADGEALGADIRLEVGSGDAFYGVVSYGLSDVRYNAEIRALQILTGEESIDYAPPHDRRHQLNAMTSISARGFNLNVRWQFGSGLPYNQSLGFDRYVLMDTLVNVVETPGDERVLYGRPYTGRLPTYHRLDVSLDREFEFSRNATATLQLGLINAYDRPNLFYLDLFTLRRVNQLPMIPTVGIKVDIN